MLYDDCEINKLYVNWYIGNIEVIESDKIEIIEDNNLDTYIEVDGGINKNTINEAKQAGIDIAVAGSAIISAENFKTAIAELK